jgi:hypothetical protein
MGSRTTRLVTNRGWFVGCHLLGEFAKGMRESIYAVANCCCHTSGLRTPPGAMLVEVHPLWPWPGELDHGA